MSPEQSVFLDVQENSGATLFIETEKSSKVAEFDAFIAQNAGVMVESERAPGYKAPFGVLMSMCAAEITEENVEMFFAEAHAMLARSSTETEENEENENEETDTEKESANKSEQKSPKVVGEKKIDNAQSHEATNSKEDIQVVEQVLAQGGQIHEAASTISSQTKAEPTDNNFSQSNDIKMSLAEGKSTMAAQEIIKELVKTSTAPLGHTETNDRSKVVEELPLRFIRTNKLPVAETKPDVESSSIELEIEALEFDEDYEIRTLEAETDYIKAEEELLVADELIQSHPDDEQIWKTPGELFALKMSELKMREDQGQPPVNPNQQFELLDYVQINSEIMSEISMPPEAVEQTILLVANHIEAMADQEVEIANQILNEIAEKMMKVQTLLENPEITPEVADTEQELTELFIKLFDYVGIKYKPDLLDSCVKLVFIGDLKKLIVKIEEEKVATQDKGTHEVIKHILKAISTIKKAVQHAYEIGKSALNLYSQQSKATLA